MGGRLLGDSRRSPAVGYLVLDRLCPALYALLGDGLLTRLDTTFGPVHNSVWRLVESVCPPGVSGLNPSVLLDQAPRGVRLLVRYVGSQSLRQVRPAKSGQF